ncbi:hypothetical protein L7F22_026114 [Adiantum nelumboides]|nr:hypothetical protein [Adiantum nelumboides]
MGEPSSSWQNFNFRDDEGSAQGMQALRLLLAKLQEAQANPLLKPSVNNLLMTEDLMLTSTQRLPSSVAPMHLEGGEGVPVMHGPMQANVVPHPLQGPLQTDGAKKKQYHGQERHVGKIREEGDFHDDDDEPPSRSRHKKRTNERRTKRSRRNSSGGSSSSSQSGRSSHGRFPKKSRKSPTPPTSPSSSPRGESSSEESSSTYKGRHPRRKHHAWKRAKKLKKFKEGGKSITFQTFDGSYGHVDKVLTFIQQFDAAFGGEDFTEASKLRNVAMHLTKSACHWWSTLCAKNQAPKTWKVCRLTIMKQFLDDDAEDNVLTAWRSLKFKEGESLQNYIEKFWDTCLKATVYRNINFSEKRQQFCAGLPEDMRTYVQALRPKTIAAVIHYTRVAYKIFKPKNSPNKGDKGKDKENGSSDVKSNNKKQASKRPYQGTNRLSPEEMERYRKENRCFRCGMTGHTYRECPQRNTKRKTPKVSNVITPSFDDSQEANELCYACGKIRDQHALILMDPGSTHNIISTELAEKLGIKVGEMGPTLEAKGAFKGQEVAVTPLIGKLRVHVQSFVEAEEFYVAPLESHDVILGVPWFHRKHAKLIFLERLITLSHKGKDIVIRTHKKGDTIPLVNHIAFEKSMKSSLSSYMIFVRDFKSEKANEPMLDASLKSFLNEHAHCFSETIPVELPPSRGVDDHRIDLIHGTSPPNRPPYRVSLAQQEEIMSQVNELLEKGMVQPSSSPFCSPVLLVQKKDGSYRMCVDYRALNKSTIKNRFPVPRIEDIFDRLQGSSYYSRIDLKSGYHQIRIVPEDIHKTAFRTTFGLYEFLVMPFGLTNAPATFNRMMDRIFRPHRSYTGVFFDDIIVYSKTLEEHKEHLKKVFEELHRNKLFINGKKSEFFLQEEQRRHSWSEKR